VLSIRSPVARVEFGPNAECTLQYYESTLSSTCDLDTPSGRRLEERTAADDEIIGLKSEIAELRAQLLTLAHRVNSFSPVEK